MDKMIVDKVTGDKMTVDELLDKYVAEPQRREEREILRERKIMAREQRKRIWREDRERRRSGPKKRLSFRQWLRLWGF